MAPTIAPMPDPRAVGSRSVTDPRPTGSGDEAESIVLYTGRDGATGTVVDAVVMGLF